MSESKQPDESRIKSFAEVVKDPDLNTYFSQFEELFAIAETDELDDDERSTYEALIAIFSEAGLSERQLKLWAWQIEIDIYSDTEKLALIQDLHERGARGDLTDREKALQEELRLSYASDDLTDHDLVRMIEADTDRTLELYDDVEFTRQRYALLYLKKLAVEEMSTDELDELYFTRIALRRLGSDVESIEDEVNKINVIIESQEPEQLTEDAIIEASKKKLVELHKTGLNRQLSVSERQSYMALYDAISTECDVRSLLEKYGVSESEPLPITIIEFDTGESSPYGQLG